MRFFFYGTLLDGDLRRALCGAAADRWAITPAILPGHRRGRSAHLAYPFLLPDARRVVEGLVADGIDAAAAGLLTLYEGDGYDTVVGRPLVATVAVDAWIFVPARPVPASLPWSLDAWRRDHKERTLAETDAWRRSLPPDLLARAAAAWRGRDPGG